jgi:uncharacterized protein YndB with AHSA1/START domain
MNKTITVETIVRADIDKVWNYWTAPEHIERWMHASDDWECTDASNDVSVGGRFRATLGAKDKSTSFEFSGVYTTVDVGKLLEYTLDDGRVVGVSFAEIDEGVRIVEAFELEHENSEEVQRSGWQAILNNFTAYVEST